MFRPADEAQAPTRAEFTWEQARAGAKLYPEVRAVLSKTARPARLAEKVTGMILVRDEQYLPARKKLLALNDEPAHGSSQIVVMEAVGEALAVLESATSGNTQLKAYAKAAAEERKREGFAKQQATQPFPGASHPTQEEAAQPVAWACVRCTFFHTGDEARQERCSMCHHQRPGLAGREAGQIRGTPTLAALAARPPPEVAQAQPRAGGGLFGGAAVPRAGGGVFGGGTGAAVPRPVGGGLFG